MPSSKVIVDVLRETSRLVQRQGWNKYSMARDFTGHGVSPDSKNASCYCLAGALVKAWRTIDPAHEDFYFKYFENKFSSCLRESYGYDRTYTRWNDEVAASGDHVVTLIHSVITSVLGEDAPPDFKI